MWCSSSYRLLRSEETVNIQVLGYNHNNITTQAIIEIDDNIPNTAKIVEMAAIRAEGKILNFNNVQVSLTVQIGDKCYTAGKASISVTRDENDVFYEVDTLLHLTNRRETFRVSAYYKVVIHRRKTNAAVDARCYDMSQGGIGLLVDKEAKYDVGDELGISIFLDKGQIIKTEGKVVRRCDSEYQELDLLGVELTEKGRTPVYNRLVITEQVKSRRG